MLVYRECDSVLGMWTVYWECGQCTGNVDSVLGMWTVYWEFDSVPGT